MADSIILPEGTKAERYQSLIQQIKSLCDGETDRIANMANTFSALHYSMNFFWTGIYEVKNEELVLGVFQGPIACTRIAYGRGVCGTSWKEKKSILVPDVEVFPGHIACSSASKSEVVVPIFKNEKVVAVIDVDSDKLNYFDETDQYYLEELAQWLSVFF